ncbi:MAG TPA: TonB-dependent receptor [Porticoccaceae bacterium]|jgi:iron complex outermembrane receptor protein|nr:TonB-dependent receptor [Gammaproteobacteria bacterium]HIL59804.1 TonB-dependent receptor [Porticoccaceae bacterium]
MNRKPNLASKLLPTAIALGLLVPAGFIPAVHGQEAADGGLLEEIIVTGARGRPRTVSDSPVPIDVFSAEDIEAVSYTDANDILRTLVPSFNLGRQPISDGGTFIRPASLRGLPTDKTLVLVNSKRRHRSSLVSIGGSGTQNSDIATIPAAAIQNLEVLRDGASAQYGSDAIAGVINFILKENNSGGSLSVNRGAYEAGDGEKTTINGNIGLPLGDDGFLSISAEIYEAAATSRGVEYCNSWFCADPAEAGYNSSAGYTAFTESPSYIAGKSAANTGYGDMVQPWGEPDAESATLFFNAGLQLDDDTEAYAFGNYRESESDGSFFYRYPRNGTIEQLRERDGGIYDPLEKYPGGFTPRFFGEIKDMSIVAGIRGELDSGLTYDFSGRRGESEIKYTLSNTINPSMGRASKKSFRPGDLVNEETQFQVDFTKEFDMGFSTPVLLAFGGSYMDESYEVVEGEPDSYKAGPHSIQDPFGFCDDNGASTAAGAAVISGGSTLNCANSSDPVYQVVGVGSNGFPGYSPQFSALYERSSVALYGDISADLSDRLFLQAAARYEDYDDFDSQITAKIAGRLELTDNLALRGSFGTAFRAPTPGQQGTTNVSTRLPNGFPVATGLFPAGGPVAGALGAVPLKPEKSRNATLGLIANFGDLDLTLDFYQIDIEDRTQAVSTRDVSTDPTSGEAYQNYLKLDAAGVPGANSIGGVFYFANGFDTTTSGADLVATYPLTATTNLSAAVSYNDTEFDSDPSAFLNVEDMFDFENFLSDWRGIYTITQDIGDLRLLVRASYYGEYANSNRNPWPNIQNYDSTWFVDVEGSYRINDSLTLTAGGRNVGDTYPEKDMIGDYCCGRQYSSGSYVDWQGAYYYGRINFSF